MSAYLFMVAHQNGYANQPKVSRHRRSEDIKSIKLSRSSTSSKSDGKSKYRFDLNKSNYVLVNAGERRLAKYESKFLQLSKGCKNHDFNEKLNRYHLPNGDLLFTERNINVLRYTYFKDFCSDYRQISKQLSAKDANGQYKLKFVRKLKELKQREHGVTGLPIMSTDVREEEEELEESEDEIDDIYREYEISDVRASSVKKLIQSNQFWNTVYQDLKCKLSEMSSTMNYLELLPNFSQLLTLYKEIIEYFLINLNKLSCNLNDLTPAEVDDLKNYKFFYFKDFNYEWFKVMSNLHYKSFNNQSFVNTSTSILGEHHMMIHRTLVNKIIETVMENMQYAFPGKSNAPTLELWDQFLRFLMTEIIMKNYGNHTDLSMWDNNDLPEPDLAEPDLKQSDSRSRSSSSMSINDDSLLTSNYSNDTAELTKNAKSLSLNMSLVHEHGLGLPDMSYKRKGFVIEPPTPRMDTQFPTPLSTHFSINSEDTKSSKRLIFSRFKKRK